MAKEGRADEKIGEVERPIRKRHVHHRASPETVAEEQNVRPDHSTSPGDQVQAGEGEKVPSHVPAPKTPQYSMRINRFTEKVVINVSLPHVPADKIALNIEEDKWYLDTFKSGHPYLVRAEYPLGVRVDEERVSVTFDGLNLCVKIPVVEGLEHTDDKLDQKLSDNEPAPPPSQAELAADPASRALWDRQTGNVVAEASNADSHASKHGGQVEREGELTAVEKLRRMGDPTLRAPKVGSVPMKHRKSVKHPEQFPTQQKKPKYTSDADLLKIAKGASRQELLKQSAKIQAHEQQERLLIQQMEAKKARREMKKTRKRAIVERARARVKE